MFVGGFDESGKERMRLDRFAEKLRVILAGHVEGMILQLDELDKAAIRRGSAENEAGLFELLAIGVVEFVTMSVSFAHLISTVKFRGAAASLQFAGLRT